MLRARIATTSSIAFGTVIAAAGILLTSCGAQDPSMSSEDTATVQSPVTTANVVPDRYIVVLKKGVAQTGVAGQAVPDVATTIGQQYGGKVVRTYQYALQGFAMDIPANALASVNADSRVAYIEPDVIGTVVDSETNAT